jgi:hypothetical protein
MTSNYEKELESRNDELQQMLAAADIWIPSWAERGNTWYFLAARCVYASVTLFDANPYRFNVTLNFWTDQKFKSVIYTSGDSVRNQRDAWDEVKRDIEHKINERDWRKVAIDR